MDKKLSICILLYSMFLFTFKVNYFLSLLIYFEFIIISMIMCLMMNSNLMNFEFFMMYLLILAVSESIMGFLILILIVRNHGHENIKMMNLMSW